MFSTSQSKAFFSQEIIKNKLISQEIQLANNVFDRIWQSKNGIVDIIKFLSQQSDNMQNITSKINQINQMIEDIVQTVQDSNYNFQFNINLRSDVKQLQHKFFKEMMIVYQDRIKELKHWLLLLQSQVQDLQQKGFLPYVENPMKNNIMASKQKNFQQFKQKLQTYQSIINLLNNKKIQKIIVRIVNSIIKKKQTISKQVLSQRKNDSNKLQQKLDISYQFNQHKSTDVQGIKNTQSETAKPIKKQQTNHGISYLLKLLQNWNFLTNFILKRANRDFKVKIEAMSNSNKRLKEGIRNYKKIMKYQQNEAAVRSGNNQMTRQQAIDFLRQMDQDLQQRFTCRNIYMIIPSQQTLNRICSCKDFNHPQAQIKQNQHIKCVRQINLNLNNSFLDQCSYLISDRFGQAEDQNQEMIV